MPEETVPATPVAELFRTLPKPPSASSLTVRKLIGRVREGAIRMPAEEIMAGVVRARTSFRDIDVAVPDRMRTALAEHWKRVPIPRRCRLALRRQRSHDDERGR